MHRLLDVLIFSLCSTIWLIEMHSDGSSLKSYSRAINIVFIILVKCEVNNPGLSDDIGKWRKLSSIGL